MKSPLAFLTFFLILPIEGHTQSWPIAIVGDTQRTTFAERLIGREKNDDIPFRILEEISKHQPRAMIHLGDVTSCGGCSNPEGWLFFEKAVAPILQLKIPLFLTFGNHEYWQSQDKMEAAVKKYFPETPGHYYSKVLDGIALIFLDSNLSDLGKPRARQQKEWLEKTIHEFNSRDEIDRILFFTHHPPFSNSKVVGDDSDCIKEFLPVFEASPKTIAWLSGHAHGYEHFFIHQRHFIVSAGGGGPRQNPKAPAPHEDLYRGTYPRPFNFLLINKTASEIKIETHGWNRGDSKFSVIDSVKVNLETSKTRNSVHN